MKLDKTEVKHIAGLARIEMTDNELETFGRQLSEILNYVGQLPDVVLDNVNTTYSWDGFRNEYREDEVFDCTPEDQELILKEAPDSKDGYIRVKSVFNK